jgi:subtilisin family serine protease
VPTSLAMGLLPIAAAADDHPPDAADVAGPATAGPPAVVEPARAAILPVGAGHAENEYVVTFRSPAVRSRAVMSVTGRGADVLSLHGGRDPWALVRADAAVVDELRADRSILDIVPNNELRLHRASPSATQDDPPWGLDRVDQRDLPLSGSYTAPSTGAGVRVYVIDDGIYADHVDFGGRVLPGAHLWSFTSSSDSLCSAHGSHVAGTIGGTYSGVAKEATLVPLRVFDCNGSASEAGVMAAIDWIVDTHPVGSPGIVNMSFGGKPSSVLDARVASAVARGLVVVGAAGNDGSDACDSSPGRSSVVITVGSSTAADGRSSFSSVGPCVDVFAPGSQIESVRLDGTTTGFGPKSGTSMAAPHVAGAVAGLLSQSPDLTPAEVYDRIVGHSTRARIADVGRCSPNRLLHVGALASGPPTSSSGRFGHASPPANATFATAASLPLTGTSTGSNVGASCEAGEPSHAGVASGASVWWRFTAPRSATVTIDTSGSDFDTVLAVYTGSSVGALTGVAANNDAPGLGTASAVTFDVTEGVTYSVAVDGFAADSGSIRLGVSWSSMTAAPLNVAGAAEPLFTGFAPVRVLDTRPTGRVASESITEVPIRGRSEIPSGANSVVLNVTVVDPLSAGYATVFPCGDDPPEASNLNFVAGQTVPNAVIAGIGSNGSICVFASAETHLLVDVAGALGATAVGVEPARVLDTRSGDGAGPVAARSVTVVPVAGRVGVPPGAVGVVLNVTVVEPSAAGFVTVFPCVGDGGGVAPEASNLNFVAGQTVPNAVVSKVGDGGAVCVFSSVDTDLLVDVNGALA